MTHVVVRMFFLSCQILQGKLLYLHIVPPPELRAFPANKVIVSGSIFLRTSQGPAACLGGPSKTCTQTNMTSSLTEE